MAKDKGTTVNVALLQSIANATETDASGNKVGRVTQEEYAAHKQFILVDGANVVDGKAAAMLNDAGKEYLANLNSGNNKDKPMYAVMTGFTPPPSQRGNRKGFGAPTQYPFETLEVGAIFFVPNSAKADAAKKLGSTVSQQNMKYRTEIPGQSETVTRVKRGPKNKAMVDDQGNKITEQVTVPKYTQDRHFIVRPVEGGKVYGSWTAPEDGAVVMRDK